MALEKPGLFIFSELILVLGFRWFILILALSLIQNGSLGKPLYSFYFTSEMTNTIPFSRTLNDVPEETHQYFYLSHVYDIDCNTMDN